jgi:Tetracyclin repressor-like, C-terminal domain
LTAGSGGDRDGAGQPFRSGRLLPRWACQAPAASSWSAERLGLVAGLLAASGADLARSGAQALLTAAMSCAAYLFQLSRPTATLRQLCVEEPRWAHDALRFRGQLTELLTLVAAGARLEAAALGGGPGGVGAGQDEAGVVAVDLAG